LKEQQIPTAVVSTAYSVTLHTLRHGIRTSNFLLRCNRLIFAMEDGREILEGELENLVHSYIEEPGLRSEKAFGTIRATGEVILGIRDEADKARVALTMAESLGISPSRTMHMGDTMGDSIGILEVAKAGGIGVAFNYNHSLEEFLRSEARREIEAGHIVLIDPKGPNSNLRNVVPYIEALRRR
jgi:hypothetical protein